MIRDILQEGIVVYDASLGEEVMVFGSIIAIKADNPMHTALCGGLVGGGRVHLCRVCEVHCLPIIILCFCIQLTLFLTRFLNRHHTLLPTKSCDTVRLKRLWEIEPISKFRGITRLAGRFLTHTSAFLLCALFPVPRSPHFAFL